MNIFISIRNTFLNHYSIEKSKLEKWVLENKDVEGSLEYESAKLGIALYDLYIAFWSSLKGAG